MKKGPEAIALVKAILLAQYQSRDLVTDDEFDKHQEYMAQDIVATITESPVTIIEKRAYSNHLVRLYAGDWERLKKFYPKPTRIVRALVSKHLKENGGLN